CAKGTGSVTETDTPLHTTALDGLHRSLGARMVPFAGYAMPVQYPTGILTEHTWTRENAGLFDVSHMGQVTLRGKNGTDPAVALERLVPGDLQILKLGRMRYTMLTQADGGILDDLMVTKLEDRLFVVVNAGCKTQDIARFRAELTDCEVVEHIDAALLALQGPKAVDVLKALVPGVEALAFLSGAEFSWNGVALFITRSGYTGEDGFEISVPNASAEALAQALLAHDAVKPIGLGARDSLRLEAGLCLYGHDITEGTSPIEADLAWTISKRRRAEGGFPGDAVIQAQLLDGPTRRRVGIQPEGRAPVREGAKIYADAGLTEALGVITSGGFGPTVQGPVAMGYVTASHAAPGRTLFIDLRGKPVPATVAALPFTPHRYVR
ncbi:MAG: glycine cleavage system aminomethyltransferase GcvT, partial [Elstera sp.]